MKNITRTLAIIAGLGCGSLALAQEPAKAEAPEDAATEATVDLPVFSAYVWRGQILDDGTSFQPSFGVTRGGFSVSAWGNYALDDETYEDNEFSEVDLTVGYTLAAGPVEVGAGWIEYLFPHQTLVEEVEQADGSVVVTGHALDGTREAYVTASLTSLPVTPTVGVYYDFDEIEGVYATAQLTYAYEASDALSAEVGVAVGFGSSDYNAGYFGIDDSTWNEGTLAASVSYAVCSACSISPAVAYTWLLDEDIQDAAKELYGDDDQVVGSVTVSCTF